MRNIDHWVVRLEYVKGEKDIRCESKQEAREALQDINEALEKDQRFVTILDGNALVALAEVQTVTVEPRYERPKSVRIK